MIRDTRITKNKIILLCLILLGCQHDKKSNNFSSNRIMHEDWYENGNIESRVWYNKALKEDSLGLWYYENGNLKAKIRFSDGKQIGPSLYYHPNGNIELFCFFNETGDGSVMYAREYNERGEVIDEKGEPIGVVYEKGLRIPPESYFDYTVIAAIPPDSEMAIHTAIKEGTPDFVTGKGYWVKDKMPLFRCFFEAQGEYPMRVISELNDTIRNVVRRDTLSFVVTVE